MYILQEAHIENPLLVLVAVKRDTRHAVLILIYVCNGILHSELPVFEAVVSPVGYYDEV